jgi:hypothetical protein
MRRAEVRRSTGLPEPHIVGMIPDMKNHPTDYRLSAGQCRRRADAAVDEVRKATWLTFADEWMKLAYEAELSASRDPPKQPAGVPNAEVLWCASRWDRFTSASTTDGKQ